MTYPNGVVHTYNYDVNDRLATMPVTMSGSTLASYTHTFNFAGHKLTESTNPGRTATYTYDAVYKLATETVTGDPPTNGSIIYTHDAVGNRLSLSSTITGIPSATYTYDVNDRLNADTYDANGNTITSSSLTYGYDFEDRMTSAGAVTMVYDGDGNRVSRTASGVATQFLVDELTPTGYAQVAEELVSGAVTRRYTHGIHRISQTQLISGIWTTHFYGYDGGGSVRQLTDAAGIVTDAYAYDAFGNTVASTGTTSNRFQYRGEEFDAALAAYYLRARYYQPKTGRFLTADRDEGRDRIPLTLNRFIYGIADPVGNSDPSGNEVAMSYGLLVNNEGTGAAMAAASSAVANACLLSPAMSILSVTCACGWKAGSEPQRSWPLPREAGGGE